DRQRSRSWAAQPGDRGEAADQRKDGSHAPEQHLPQAPDGQSDRPRALCPGARPAAVIDPQNVHPETSPEMSRRSSRLAWIATTCLLFAGLFWLTLVRVGVPRRVLLPFSVDRDCAIAVTDDTDKFQFDTTAPVYDALNEAGWRVTKTVWAFDTEEKD